MHKVSELNLLVRACIELPPGLKMARVRFQEGWDFAGLEDARRMEKSVQRRGWHLIRMADGSLRSGVGHSAQDAVASALKLALRYVSLHSNAVEVEHIEVSEYPWFFLAKVRVFPYRVQQDPVLSVLDDFTDSSALAGNGHSRAHAPWMYPRVSSATPVLRQMLIASRRQQARRQ